MEDKYLKDKFSHLKEMEMQPNNRIWNSLESRLKNKRKNRFQSQFNIAVAAALVILATIIATQILSPTKPTSQTAAEISTPVYDSLHTSDSVKVPK